MKNIRISLNPRLVLKPLILLFTKFHFTLFIVLVVAGLGSAVIILNDLLINLSTADEGYTSPIDAGTIDQATLERVKQLHTSDESLPPADTPSGRTNPFGE